MARPRSLRILTLLARHGDACAVHVWTLDGPQGTLQASSGECAKATARPAEELFVHGLLTGAQPRVWLKVAEDPVLSQAEWVVRHRIFHEYLCSLSERPRLMRQISALYALLDHLHLVAHLA